MLLQVLSNFAAACQPKAAGIIPTWYKYLPGETDDTGRCTVKFSIENDFPKILLVGFEIVMFIGGVAAVVMILYGGFQYLIAQGNPDNSRKARSTIINALIGLVISLSAVAVVNLIGRNV